MIERLEDFLPLIAPDVPGAPDSIILLRLKDAFRRFCSDTESWREDVEVDTVAGQSDYTITPSNEATIRRVVYVRVKTTDSDVFDDLFDADPNYYSITNGTLSFDTDCEPSVSITNGLRVRCALYPTMDFEEVSDDFLERWSDGIANLARYMLLKTPGKPYTNTNYASQCYNEYRNALISAKRETHTENKNLHLYVRQLGGIL